MEEGLVVPVFFGGDYNPEQWPEEVWAEDVELMGRAGVSMATVGVFSWARISPREGVFDFDWLDRVIAGLHEGGVRVDLATATASPPPWLTHKYPEVLPVTESGVRLAVGSRQQYCPSSPVYRRFAGELVARMVERYADHPAVELWHVNNEFGCHNSPCVCEVSAAAFRGWLEAKYGTVAALNAAWGTAFWSQAYGEWAEIYPPSQAPTFRNPTQLLDWNRFSSDELLDCYRLEYDIIRSHTDYVDVVADDRYPDPADPLSPVKAAMARDLMRSLRGGQPWLLMEQAPSAQHSRTRNAPKRPGQNRAWSYQAVARGADAVLYFQWRQSAHGSEKFVPGMVSHSSPDTRIWREIVQLGTELKGLDRIVGVRQSAQVAFLFDWDSWWSIEQGAVPAQLKYVDQLARWYRPFFDSNVLVDFLRPSDDLSGYKLVVVPSLFAATADAIEAIVDYAASGGSLFVTFQSLITDENAVLTAGGYLGALAEVLGVWVEEFAPLATTDDIVETQGWPVIPVDADISQFEVGEVWAEFVHSTSSEVRARFAQGDLAGWPALTRRSTGAGEGSAWYCATLPNAAGARAILHEVMGEAGVDLSMSHFPDEVEAVRRGDLTFFINHSSNALTVTHEGQDVITGLIAAEFDLPSQAVAIIENIAP